MNFLITSPFTLIAIGFGFECRSHFTRTLLLARERIEDIDMPKRTTKSDNVETPGAFPWGKVIAGIAGSAVATRLIRKVPLGRIVIAATPLIVAALRRGREPPKDGPRS